MNKVCNHRFSLLKDDKNILAELSQSERLAKARLFVESQVFLVPFNRRMLRRQKSTAPMAR